MIKEPRLRFTEEERADPALEKPIRKAEKAAAKADKAQAKIPKKQVKRAEVDPKTGKVTTKLSFEDKKPPSKLSRVVASSISFASPQAGKLIHSAAPPSRLKPVTLGFQSIYALDL